MTIILFQLIVLLFSAIIHEVAHGAVADSLGDDTAKSMGRLTLNPIKHLDPFGSFILPLSLYAISGGSFVFGWAKPVPYNPRNLKNPKKDSGLIALAGPLSNIAIAILTGVVYRLAGNAPALFPASFLSFLNLIIIINISLAIFNLVPIPPLDGSKALFSVLPRSFLRLTIFLEKYGFFFLIFFLVFGINFIIPVIYAIYSLII